MESLTGKSPPPRAAHMADNQRQSILHVSILHLQQKQIADSRKSSDQKQSYSCQCCPHISRFPIPEELLLRTRETATEVRLGVYCFHTGLAYCVCRDFTKLRVFNDMQLREIVSPQSRKHMWHESLVIVDDGPDVCGMVSAFSPNVLLNVGR